MVAEICNFSSDKQLNRRMEVHTDLYKNQGPISKITKAKNKRTGSMAQAMECVPSKHKVLSSNPILQTHTQNIVTILHTPFHV
jgi:hypothetical protein